MREYYARRTETHSAQKQNLNMMVLQRSFWPFATRKMDIDLPPRVSMLSPCLTLPPVV